MINLDLWRMSFFLLKVLNILFLYLQRMYLSLTLAILRHSQTRRHLLSTVLYPQFNKLEKHFITFLSLKNRHYSIEKSSEILISPKQFLFYWHISWCLWRLTTDIAFESPTLSQPHCKTMNLKGGNTVVFPPFRFIKFHRGGQMLYFDPSLNVR